MVSGKSLMSRPLELGNPQVSTSLMTLTMVKMKAVIDSVLWPTENTVA